MGQYLPIVAIVVLAVVFAGLSRVTSRLLSPKRSTREKRAPYECGIVASRASPERFPVDFYMVAMLFIVFDIEIIVLYPWAVIYRDLGAAGRDDRPARGPGRPCRARAAVCGRDVALSSTEAVRPGGVLWAGN